MFTQVNQHAVRVDLGYHHSRTVEFGKDAARKLRTSYVVPACNIALKQGGEWDLYVEFGVELGSGSSYWHYVVSRNAASDRYDVEAWHVPFYASVPHKTTVGTGLTEFDLQAKLSNIFAAGRIASTPGTRYEEEFVKSRVGQC